MAIKLKISSGDYSAEIEAGKTATLHTSLKYLANDVVFEVVEQGEPSLISFTISGTSYQSPDGWSWEQWVDSDYSENSFTVDSNGRVYRTTGIYGYLTTSSNAIVKPTDDIISGENYGVMHSGGAD